jgi:hypothetical protein
MRRMIRPICQSDKKNKDNEEKHASQRLWDALSLT